MKKTDALKLFGGLTKTAKAIGISPAAVCKWPDVLSSRIADRVEAARHRISSATAPELAKEVGHG